MEREVVEEIKREFHRSVEDIKRHFGIVAEGQDSTIQMLAEGLNSRIDGLESRMDGLGAKIDTVDRRLDRKLDGLTQIVQLTHSELTARLNDHEARIGAVERRQP
jgi:hypothetical protein